MTGPPAEQDRLLYSVVIPSRARRTMLLTALESVYAQTVPPSEVIVVVDGDVDGSADAVARLFPDARLILHDESLGPARSRTDGLRAATADWICLLDDDDIWHSRKQESFRDYLRSHPTCQALRSAFWQFAEDDKASELNGFLTEIFAPGQRVVLERHAEVVVPRNNFGYLDIEGHSLAEMLRKNCGVTSSTMFRRELLSQIPDVPSVLRTAEDWLLFVYIASLTEWHLVPGRWFFYRVHGSQLTTSQDFAKWRNRLTAWERAWDDVGLPQGMVILEHSDEYADEVHEWVWQAVRQGRWAEAVAIYRGGRRFLGPTFLQLSVWLPPPLRWRLRRFLRRGLSQMRPEPGADDRATRSRGAD